MTVTFDIAQIAPALPAGISLDQCRLDDDRDVALAEAWASLSASEQARANRFRFTKHAARYIRGRGFVRRKLAQRLGCRAIDVALTQGAHHKPTLRHSSLGFNLTHSRDIALLAIRDGGEIGVDLELADRALDPERLAASCLCEHEIAALNALPRPARRARFLDFWTAKEALMKLTGAGMSLDPKSISLRLCDGHPCGFDAPSAHRSVMLASPQLGPDLHVSIAWSPS